MRYLRKQAVGLFLTRDASAERGYLPRDANAERGYEIACRLSVCLSVCL